MLEGDVSIVAPWMAGGDNSASSAARAADDVSTRPAAAGRPGRASGAKGANGSSSSNAPPGPIDAAAEQTGQPNGPAFVRSGAVPRSDETAAPDEDDDDDVSVPRPTKDLLADSTLHDRDFRRLTSCYNPFTCPGLRPSTWRGAMEGCWEGNFSFFDFDAFREMLAGQSRALYEGPFGEQHQVWRLKETFVRPISEKRQASPKIEEMEDDSPVDKGKARLPLNGPMTNAGFPTDLPSTTTAGLATPTAESTSLNATIRQQVDVMEGYEVIPDQELDEALEGDGEGVEILVTGVGHSAWGRFILKGRIRAWDGLCSLVKEYAVSHPGLEVHAYS